MNISHFRHNLGKRVKPWPAPRVKLLDGRLLPLDDEWIIEHIDEDKRQVRLARVGMGHVKVLGFDNIREIRTPNYLLLRCQLTLEGKAVHIDPLVGA